VNLQDPSPRWVAVRFEVSPADRPAQVRSYFTTRLPARLEPTDRPGEVRLTIDGRFIEQHLMVGEEPSPGSFSDFVWIFDSETGHVRTATFSGILLRELGWGFAAWKTDARVEVQMDTREAVGFEPSRFLGKSYPRLCATRDPSRCTIVEPQPYDPTTGYVNAVGRVTAHSGGLQVKSFSPLGEAIFSEIDDPFDSIWTRTVPAIHADVAASPPQH
jgi:hypothetical protein